MWQIVWEFRVATESREEFERIYGSEGEWAKLFRRSEHFRGTALLRDPVVAGRYLTIDAWSNAEAFDRFKTEFAADYKALDARCEPLTEYEMKIGGFYSL
jgi:heme-degrading monooxygenase HmoA